MIYAMAIKVVIPAMISGVEITPDLPQHTIAYPF